MPGLVDAVRSEGVVGRAFNREEHELTCINPRDFTQDVHRTVDDRPYGGGPGMVMKPEPLVAAIEHARATMPDGSRVIVMSPQGARLTQSKVAEYSRLPGLALVAGRYEGIDERVTTVVDEELSLGDYVLSGGELAAMVVIDSVMRLQADVLGDGRSAQEDSFSDGLLDHPHYTRPENFAGQPVPTVLASGDHKKIERWRLKQALGRTWQRRPELLETRVLSQQEKALLDEFIRELNEGFDEHTQ